VSQWRLPLQFSFTESLEAQIDDLLMRICVELQLDDTRYQLAATNYKGVANWLESQNLVARLQPEIYPQGSMLLETTVRPLIGEEYDLDFVCQFICSPTYFSNPIKALDLIEDTLRISDVYKPMVERMNRCIRLNYVRKFHLDILPACKDAANGGTCIVVPDRKLKEWVASNPKGYAGWFDERARQIVIRRLLERAAPLPDPKPAHAKLPLRLCVQLFKRWRDIHYGDTPLAPISIVLTTLAAHPPCQHP
jgi:Second Messenger Oligonucleotide or Dinucleotide Synthetase domain